MLGAAGAGYAVYANRNRKREAAQRMAQKRVAQQRAQTTAAARTQTAAGTRPQQPGAVRTGTPAEPGSAQQAARIRNGIYTGSSGTAVPKAGGSIAGGQASAKPYSRNVDNPYGRYTSGAEEDADYTASFKPEGSRETSTVSRRRRNPDQNRTES